MHNLPLLFEERNLLLENQNIKFIFDEKATKWIAENGYDEEFGARPLKRLIQQEVENVLALKLLKGEIKRNTTVYLSAYRDSLAFY